MQSKWTLFQGQIFDRLDRKRTRSKPPKPVISVSTEYKKSAKENLEAATKTPKNELNC